MKRFSAHHESRLIDQLVLHEGLRLKAYRCTAGKWTIGIGRNFEDNWFTPEECAMLRIPPTDWWEQHTKLVIDRDQAFALLRNDISKCLEQLERALPWFKSLDSVRQRVLVDMCFNLGLKGLLGFKNTLKNIEIGNWAGAKKGMLASKWAKDVGDGEGGRWDRAERLAGMMLTGQDYWR